MNALCALSCRSVVGRSLRKFRSFSSEPGSHTLPSLPYAYDALEPVISSRIMTLHHQKHHQTYVTSLNSIEAQIASTPQSNLSLTILKLSPALKFHQGGHINHSLLWESLCKPDSQKCSTDAPNLHNAICESYGSLDHCIELLNKKAAGVQGSGWGWLGVESLNGKKQLVMKTMMNQDPVEIEGVVPVFGIDMWEHSYYLQYENNKVEYLKQIWRCVNWNTLEQRFVEAATQK
mmetsp:Transcript_7571/g.13709  ORF Transcript_7571/g.13709 Transcript_7571/m.13709 type:complete len:233 (-) Transcript_7571:56-754(-)